MRSRHGWPCSPLCSGRLVRRRLGLVTWPSRTSITRVTATCSASRRSWVTSSSVPSYCVERLLKLLDRGQVEMVRRLVEHQQVRPRSASATPGRPGSARPATAARPAGRRRRRRGRTWRAASSPRPRSSPDCRAERVEPASPRARRSAWPGRSRRSRPTRRASRGPSSSGIRPSSACSSVVLPEPLSPRISTRSPQLSCRLTGPSVNAPRLTTASDSTATTSPLRAAAPNRSRSSHSLRGSATGSSRSRRPQRRRGLGAEPAGPPGPGRA